MRKVKEEERKKLIEGILKENPEALKELTERQMEVLKLRYGLENGKERNLSAVGEELGISKERVGQLETKIYYKFSKKESPIGQRKGELSLRELTPREKEVLELLTEGLSTPEIGGRLSISPQTVKNHISSIYTKLGVRNRVEALRKAKEEMPSEVMPPKAKTLDYLELLNQVLLNGGEFHLIVRNNRIEKINYALFREKG